MTEDLKVKVREFMNGQISRRDFLQEVNGIIIRIPSYWKCYDKDVVHEFYAYIVAKIEKILSRYTEYQSATFNTWFLRVLNREFFFFHKKWHKKETFESNSVKNLFASDLANLNNEYDNLDHDMIDFSILSENEKNVAALKYGVSIGGRDISSAVTIIREKIEKKKRMEEKVVKYYHKIMMVQSELRIESNKEKIKELQYRERKLKKGKQKLLQALSTYKTFPTNAWVANQLNLANGTVAAYINKIKVKIYNRHETDVRELVYRA